MLSAPITLHAHGTGWESVEVEKGVREEVEDCTPGEVVMALVCEMRGTAPWCVCAKSVGIYLCDIVLRFFGFISTGRIVRHTC